MCKSNNSLHTWNEIMPIEWARTTEIWEDVSSKQKLVFS
jgi:hypothetical protein